MLEITDLHKRYGDVVALDGCSFSVGAGRMLGFLGPNGAGKTTAMRSIFGLVDPDSGSVSWQDQPVDDQVRRRFGYMPEQRGLYPKMKARDQISYMGQLHDMSSSEATAEAERWLDRLGLGDRMDEPVENLSHGNQQRVQLAVALVHSPEVLVLDEPFSGLDPIGATTMSDVLREEAAEGRAVVFSSHQLDVVEDLCEEVAIINRGSIVLSGPVRDLQDRSPVRRLELELEGSADDVLAQLSGVHSARVTDDGRHVLMIDAATDVRTILGKAEAAGTVRHFIYTTPSLSDLFREAVA